MKLKINKENLKKVGKGALIAGAGAAITIVSDSALAFDYGEWSVVVATVLSILINLGRKVLAKESEE